MSDLIYQGKVFTVHKASSGVAHLNINDESAELNTLKASFIDEFSTALCEIKSDVSITCLFIISGKSDSFIVGADINMLAECKTQEHALALSRQGQMLFGKLSRLQIPTIAVIHGTCMGGGLELALACDYRVCSEHESTIFSFPEVKLGLLPGSGGTQRLPKLIGLQRSLELMLTGKNINAQQALKIGLVDDVVMPTQLLAAAKKIKRFRRKLKKTLFSRILESNKLTRQFIYKKAKAGVLAKTYGNYPAPLKIIECVQFAMEEPDAKGYQKEADCFAELVVSPEANQLINLFFAHKKITKKLAPKSMSRVGILGGGLMGGGIAYVTANKAKYPVRIKDINTQGIQKALQYSFNLLMAKVKRGFISEQQLNQKMNLITGTTNYQGFAHTDIIIEAVFEDLPLKQLMLKEVEDNCKDTTIFASNTSSIPIRAIAEHAKRPENVIGMHFFSPVEKMPLIEVIPHKGSSQETIEKIKHLAQQQGKTFIVVQDTAGFYVNRILAPYINEALFLLEKGIGIEFIDKSLLTFGFPVGPIQLLDEVGLDVSSKISPILQAAFGDRFTSPYLVKKLLNDGRLGKKNKKGFYIYNKNKQRVVDESIYTLLNLTINNNIEQSNISQRCVYLMLNEAARCLSEQIIESAEVGDIGAIFGIGFPPFLGGPFRYLDTIGILTFVRQMNKWAKEINGRYQPCDLLKEMAEKGEKFYEEN